MLVLVDGAASGRATIGRLGFALTLVDANTIVGTALDVLYSTDRYEFTLNRKA